MTLRMLERKKCIDPKFSFYDSAELVNASHWNKVAGKNNIYLSLEYLTALEKALQDELEYRYVIFYNNLLMPVAIAYLQLTHFKNEELKYREMFCKIGDKIKNKLLQSIDVKILVCGNIFSCGENGFAFTSEIDSKEAFQLLAQSMKRLAQEEEKNGQVSFALIKEFWPESTQISDILKDSNYKEFMIDVNMVMKINSFWKTMDDYLASMNTKFRTKAKGVYKKSGSVRVEEFKLNDIINHRDKIEYLYKSVLSQAQYKFGELNGPAFVNFKENLKHQFIFKGYFIEEKMVGFSSVFHFNNIVDANYVGLDYAYNKEYSIYQRMLYDFVELSITLQANELRLGRTAELIKSSIGAEPVNMKLYAKHRNSISNKLLGPLISSISPSEFELRSPFRK